MNIYTLLQQPTLLMQLALLVPLVGAALILACHRWPNLRETITLITACSLLGCVAGLLPSLLGGGRPEVVLLDFLPGVPLMLSLEPLGMLFALIASGLWIVNSLYSIGYMRGNNEQHQTGFYICFAIALSATMGIALAGNLLTLFLFYEALTLSTYPLVTHKRNDKALAGGRIYLGYLLFTSMVLLLPAIVAVWVLTGTLNFESGGILKNKVSADVAMVLYALFLFGTGKAALMPFHRWLPAAMVAPTPVSALLHAVAVVKSGVFVIAKVSTYIFGLDFLHSSGGSQPMLWVAIFTMLTASLIAMTKDNLKARLAYSTVSQLAYVVLGATMATSLGLLGSAFHMTAHAVGKITLFFCAGAIYTAAHKTEISQLNGLARQMPITFTAFAIAAISIIGLPPTAGFWGKWYLMSSALESGLMLVVAALAISSLLNIVYLLEIPMRGFFLPPAEGSDAGLREAPLPSVIALGTTAVACVALFVFPEPLMHLLAMWRPS